MDPFRTVTTWDPAEDGFEGQITPDWMQGRAAFGGVLAAGAVRLVGDAAPERTIRSVDARFFEPVGVGPMRATRRCLREGRSVAHWEVEVTQGERSCFRAVICATTPRASGLRVDTLGGPPPGDPDAWPTLPYLEGLTPSFTRHVDFRVDRGMPYSGAKAAEIHGWCRFKEGSEGIEALVGLLDAWPAPDIATATRPAPASTIHWTAHLLADRAPAPDAWLRYRAHTLFAADGTTTFAATLWGPDGAPLAWSEQLTAVFDR